MTKRSFFLTVAAGLLASVAFATPSQAANQTVTTTVSFSATGGLINDFTVTYSPSVDVIATGPTISGIPGGTVSETGPSTLTALFTGTASGAFTITFTTPSTASGFTLSNTSFSGSTTQVTSTVGVSPSAIPEPTSMALLGIGMTGFLAFRRLFKRSSVALTS